MIRSKPTPGVNECLLTVAFGCVGDLFGSDLCRSVYDNEHHPEDYVIYVDGNPHSEDGDTSYLMNDEEELIGNLTGKNKGRLGDSLDKQMLESKFVRDDAEYARIVRGHFEKNG